MVDCGNVQKAFVAEKKKSVEDTVVKEGGQTRIVGIEISEVRLLLAHC